MGIDQGAGRGRGQQRGNGDKDRKAMVAIHGRHKEGPETGKREKEPEGEATIIMCRRSCRGKHRAATRMPTTLACDSG